MVEGVTYDGSAWPLPDDAISHLRSSGTFTRFLRHWVREQEAMTLMKGLRNACCIPSPGN